MSEDSSDFCQTGDTASSSFASANAAAAALAGQAISPDMATVIFLLPFLVSMVHLRYGAYLYVRGPVERGSPGDLAIRTSSP